MYLCFQSSLSCKFHVVGYLSNCISLGYAFKGTRCTTSEMVTHTSCCWDKGRQLPWRDQNFFACYLDTIASPFVYFLSCWSSNKTWSPKAGKFDVYWLLRDAPSWFVSPVVLVTIKLTVLVFFFSRGVCWCVRVHLLELVHSFMADSL